MRKHLTPVCCLQSRWNAVIKGCRSGCYRIRVNTRRASLCLQQVICISCYGIQISSGWQRVTFEYSLTVCLPFLIKWPERQQKCHSWVFHHPSAELCFLSVVSHTHSATLWIRKEEDCVVFLWPCRLFCCSLWIWIHCFNSSLRHLTVHSTLAVCLAFPRSYKWVKTCVHSEHVFVLNAYEG